MGFEAGRSAFTPGSHPPPGRAGIEGEAMMAKKIKLKFDRCQLEREFKRKFTEVEITKLDLLLQDEYDKTKDRRKKKKLRRKAVLSAIAPEVKT